MCCSTVMFLFSITITNTDSRSVSSVNYFSLRYVIMYSRVSQVANKVDYQ